MTPEGKVKAKIDKILKSAGEDIWFAKPRGGPYGKAGTPDYLVCVGGFFLAIEAKAGDNQPTPLQREQHKMICRAGGMVLVVNEENLADVETAVKFLLRKNERA